MVVVAGGVGWSVSQQGLGVCWVWNEEEELVVNHELYDAASAKAAQRALGHARIFIAPIFFLLGSCSLSFSSSSLLPLSLVVFWPLVRQFLCLLEVSSNIVDRRVSGHGHESKPDLSDLCAVLGLSRCTRHGAPERSRRCVYHGGHSTKAKSL